MNEYYCKLRIFTLTSIAFLSLFLLFSRAASASDSGAEGNDAFSKLVGSLKEAASDYAEADRDIYNLLLIGVDRRDKSWNGNSDAMILISVNRGTKKVTMMSFMRDLYAEIEGHGTGKLNSACAIGGPELLVSTLKSNYDVDIDNYACTDFASMSELIDELGGVEIEVTDAEAEYANGLIWDMAGLIGVDPEPHYFSGAGYYNCDGLQTVAYARIRFVGNNDYQRTQRQRDIIEQLVRKASSMDAAELTVFMSKAFDLVNHDLSNAEILALAARLQEILSYEIVESRVPYDGMYHSQNEILVPEQPGTNERIQEELNS